MSWDVWLFVPPSDAVRVEDINPDYPFPPLDPGLVLDAAKNVFGNAWVTDGDWGNVEGPEIFAEISFPKPDDETAVGRGSVYLFVRGYGENTVEQILRFADRLGCRAFDSQMGDWLTVDTGATSLARWAGYRDRVAGVDGIEEGDD
jgi:hypothetical protein